jgi:hypothetical protein
MPEACLRTTAKAEDPRLAFVQRHRRRGWSVFADHDGGGRTVNLNAVWYQTG